MAFRPASLRLSCWLALFAMLALTLLPALSHAWASSRGGGAWSEVCTARGTLRLAEGEPAPDPAAPMSSGGLLGHCHYCAPSTGTLGLPPAPLALPPPRLRVEALSDVALQDPRTLFAWRHAQPRGPPAYS